MIIDHEKWPRTVYILARPLRETSILSRVKLYDNESSMFVVEEFLMFLTKGFPEKGCQL